MKSTCSQSNATLVRLEDRGAFAASSQKCPSVKWPMMWATSSYYKLAISSSWNHQNPPETQPHFTTMSDDSVPSAPPFSAFTQPQKQWVVFLAALAGMFSPMSSFIFYPAITSIATSLGVTVGMVNLAITTYMVVSGVTPAILGNAADKVGRRPVYILALTLYLVANFGLALQNSFGALLALRMLQSAGSSGKIHAASKTGYTKAYGLRDNFIGLWHNIRYHNSRRKGLLRWCF